MEERYFTIHLVAYSILVFSLHSFASETPNTSTLPNVITPDPFTSSTTPPASPNVSKPKIRAIPRIKAANKANQEFVEKIHDSLNLRRETIQRLGERGLLTAAEMTELGNELNKLTSNLKDLARSKEKLTKKERRSFLNASIKFRNLRIARQFNNSFDNGMTQEKLNAIHRKNVEDFKETMKEARSNRDLSTEDKFKIRDIQDEINQVIAESKADGTFDSPAIRQKLGLLRGRFNTALRRAENRAEQAAAKAERAESQQASINRKNYGPRRPAGN